MQKYSFLILLICLFFTPVRTNAQLQAVEKNAGVALKPDEENLNVFQQWIRWNNPGTLLLDHLISQAMDLYEIRDREIAKLVTKSQWMKRQAFVKDKLLELVGPFPEKTPLNPKVTGIIRRDGYRIEKIIYESMPGFYVTGCLYIPEGIRGRVPAILNVIGHNQDAFRAPLYQVLNYNLVRKGMIIFAIDPPGQGEHVQYFDPKINFSSIGYTVVEHCYFGNQCFLSGSSAARYFIWDGIRAIDYLVSRREVDPERIGVTGFSGGGTITSYMGAFDDRVKVAVPCSWATSGRRQLETKGVQDAECSFIHAVAEGITFEDLIEVRAPKPTLMTFVSRDEYLTLQGAREAFAEAKAAYRAFGLEDNLRLSEDDSKHHMTPKIRYDIYSFFMKHFGLQGDPSELEAEIVSPEELKVTPTGQISTSFGGEMIFDVNRKESEKLMAELEMSRKNTDKHLGEVIVKAKEISGFIAPSGTAGNAFINGRYHRDGYSVGKYAIMGEGDYPIPILLFVPDDNKEKHPAVVYLHPGGKAADALPGGEIEKLVRKGYVVSAADVPGIGETKNTAARALTDGYTSVLIGRSVVAVQAGDIIRVVNWLKSLSEADPLRIGLVGIREMCIPLLHAAAFDKSVNNVTLIGSPISYRSIVMNRNYRIGVSKLDRVVRDHPYEVDFSWGIAGVLKGYDLPDLIGCIAPRRVALVEPKDYNMENAPEQVIKEDMAFPLSVYSAKGGTGNIRIVTSSVNPDDIVDWCFR
jgi:cephalosporin-C deacetylase-like acetyl esterase